MPAEMTLPAWNDELSLLTVMLNLAVGIGLAALLGWHFCRYGATLSNRREFALVFPFVLLTTVLIISVVKSSLALSLGLVGALSIVRFRTPIKEPEELAYLFLAIAMGLGLGANQTLVTVVVGPAILLAISALRWQRPGAAGKTLHLMVTVPLAPDRDPEGVLPVINRIVGDAAGAADLRRFDANDEQVDALFVLSLDAVERVESLMGEIREALPGVELTFVDQSRLPEV